MRERQIHDSTRYFFIYFFFISSLLSIDSDSALKKFLEATSGMSAAERAKELEQNKVL